MGGSALLGSGHTRQITDPFTMDTFLTPVSKFHLEQLDTLGHVYVTRQDRRSKNFCFYLFTYIHTHTHTHTHIFKTMIDTYFPTRKEVKEERKNDPTATHLRPIDSRCAPSPFHYHHHYHKIPGGGGGGDCARLCAQVLVCVFPPFSLFGQRGQGSIHTYKR